MCPGKQARPGRYPGGFPGRTRVRPGVVRRQGQQRALCRVHPPRCSARFRTEQPCAQRGPADDPWLQIIPCKHGHICPWGGDLLAICTSQRGGIARRLMALPFVQVVQDGSDGINATFPVERFAEIVKPKRRRRLTPEQRQAAVERLRDFQFSPARQSDSEGLERRRRLRTISGARTRQRAYRRRSGGGYRDAPPRHRNLAFRPRGRAGTGARGCRFFPRQPKPGMANTGVERSLT